MDNTSEEQSEDSNINDEHQSMSSVEVFSDSPPASSRKRTIALAIAGVLLLSAIVFLSSDSIETDEVLITQSIASRCDETLITFSWKGEILQETLYKPSNEEDAVWFGPDYREMADGDVAVAVVRATSLDDSECVIAGNIYVTVDTDGDGDYDDEIENTVKIEEGGGVVGHYETVELTGIYVHEK